MLDPFLQPIQKNKIQQKHSNDEEYAVEMYGHSLDTSGPHPSVGLWVGRLLIRMGQKLTKQDTELDTTKDRS